MAHIALSGPLHGILSVDHPLAVNDGKLRAQIQSVEGDMLTFISPENWLLMKNQTQQAAAFFVIQNTELNALSNGLISAIPADELTEKEALIKTALKEGISVELSHFKFSRNDTKTSLSGACRYKILPASEPAWEAIEELLLVRFDHVNKIKKS